MCTLFLILQRNITMDKTEHGTNKQSKRKRAFTRTRTLLTYTNEIRGSQVI